MLAEFVAFFRRNQALENAAQNVRADFLEIELVKFAQNGTPGIRREFVRENERASPIFFSGIKKRFVIPGDFHRVLKRLAEMNVADRAGDGNFLGILISFSSVNFRRTDS